MTVDANLFERHETASERATEGSVPVPEIVRSVPPFVSGVYRLVCPIKDYDWGSIDALPRLFGWPVDGRTHAEMWIGAHPSAPSVAIDASGRHVPLDALLESELPDRPMCAGRAAPRLPFLMKALAAERPLSLQLHPDAARAARGYALEVRQGSSLGTSVYQDPWHKPEMLYALQPFVALCGFARPRAAAELLSALTVDGLTEIITLLGDRDEARALRHATERLLSMESRRAGDLVQDVVAAASRSTEPAYRTLVELGRYHPSDPAVLVSLLLNTVTLTPGEALFVPPNTLHSYVRGVGIEVMATSDNVLRAGLTGKQVHVDRVLDAADYLPAPPRIVRGRRAQQDELVFEPGVSEFCLSVLRCESATERLWSGVRPRSMLCLGGSFSLSGAGAELSMRPGDAAFIAPGSVAVRVLGQGTLISAMPGS